MIRDCSRSSRSVLARCSFISAASSGRAFIGNTRAFPFFVSAAPKRTSPAAKFHILPREVHALGPAPPGEGQEPDQRLEVLRQRPHYLGHILVRREPTARFRLGDRLHKRT